MGSLHLDYEGFLALTLAHLAFAAALIRAMPAGEMCRFRFT